MLIIVLLIVVMAMIMDMGMVLMVGGHDDGRHDRTRPAKP